MSNPLVHTLVFTIAVVIPGGLVIYFAWRAYNNKKAKAAKNTQKILPDLEERDYVRTDSDVPIAANSVRNLYRYSHMDRM